MAKKKPKAAKGKTKAKAKPESVVVLEEDDDDSASSARPEEDPSKPRARYDVYFGLTLLTTLILIGAAALLYLDQEDLKSPANTGFNPPSITAGALGIRPVATPN